MQPRPPTDPLPAAPPAAAPEGGEMRAELNWVAQTAAIIAEALSNQHAPTDASAQVSGGLEVNRAAGSAPTSYPINGLRSEEARLLQTDSPPSQSSSREWDSTAGEHHHPL